MQLIHYAYFAAALFTGLWFFHFFRKNLLPGKPAADVNPSGFTRFQEDMTAQELAADSVFPVSLGTHVPQDSTLRRHFISHVQYMLEAVVLPYPTDSVLSRHADQLLKAEFLHCLNDTARWERLLADYDDVRAEMSTDNQPMTEPASIQAVTVDSCEADGCPDSRTWIPEDSVLRRHFLRHCRSMLEEMMPPGPTDSVLARHYDQLMQSDFEECLRDETRMAQLFEHYATHRRNTLGESAMGDR